MIPMRGQTMNNPLNQTRTRQSPGPWHPWADIDWLLGATDLGTRSVLLLIRNHLPRLKVNWYEPGRILTPLVEGKYGST